MSHVSKRAVTGVWLFLVCATLLTIWSAAHHGLAGQWTLFFIMVIAAIKARLVIRFYMEMKTFPLVWRLAFDAWILVVCSMIMMGYWLTL